MYFSSASSPLRPGCNVNHKGFGVNRTPLHYAIQNGHVELALELLDRGADANDCHVTPLHDMVSLRFFRGGGGGGNNSNNSNNNNHHASTPPPRRVQVQVPSPFCYAIELGCDRLVESMLSKGLCSPNSFGVEGHESRPLTLALQGVVTEEFVRRFRIVKLLLERGAKVEKNDSLLAVRWPTAEVLRELLRHGADPNWTMTLPNWTLLHILCAEPFVGERMEKIRTLIEAGADPNAKDQVRKRKEKNH